MNYPGGKNGAGVYQKIINQMPPHKVYIEAFLGGGAIMRYKRPTKINIGIDKDPVVIHQWNQWGYPGIDIHQGDALEWLSPRKRFYSILEHLVSKYIQEPDTLIYLDPPYLMSTRSSQREIYYCEMTDQDHVRLLEIITQLNCMVMVSGYWSEMYANALHDWRTVTFQAQTRGGRTATEWLWMNYPEPGRLHDYQYLGENYRERERIKRKAHRWVHGKNGLTNLPRLERYAIIAAIDETFPFDGTAKNGDMDQ